jgi:phage/plasmid-like protein (TIGR03299 family)
MAHDIETMAYTADVPWHGLGVRMTDAALTSTDEMIRQSGLDWTVSKVPLVTADRQDVTEAYATRRDSDGRILGTVGPAYTVRQNRENLDWFNPFLESGEVTYHTAGSLAGGSRTWVLAQIGSKGNAMMEIRPGDKVVKFLLFASSHDASMAHNGGLTPVRVVCRNTLSMALADRSMFKVKHTASAGARLTAVRESLAKANEAFTKTAEVYRLLAKASIDREGIEAYAKAVYQVTDETPVAESATAARFGNIIGQDTAKSVSGRMAGILADVVTKAQRGRGNTGASFWDAYNGVTERISWGTDDSKVSADKRMNSAWFGSGADVNARALRVAMQTVAAVA